MDEIDDVWESTPDNEKVRYNHIMDDEQASDKAGEDEAKILNLAIAKILLRKKIIKHSELVESMCQIISAIDQENARSRDELSKQIRRQCPVFSEELNKVLGGEWEIE